MNVEKHILPDFSWKDCHLPKKYNIRAFCTSDRCIKKNFFWLDTTFRGAVKEVSKNVDQCPDCDHYLFWRRMEEIGV